jgi:acetoin utilization deacetylase AcuC-like enzyme
MAASPLSLKTGVVKDDRYLDHNPGSWHPESPQRLKVIYQHLETSGMTGFYKEIHPRYASEKEISLVHTAQYIHSIASTEGKEVALDPDTVTSPLSYQTACLAVGGGLNLIKAIYDKKIDNGFALIRPPGHHAEKNKAMGFCLFNNIAIATAYILKEGLAKKILIVFWDVHHGNGTQHAFYNSSDVLYFSIHQYPHYPLTGKFEEIGEGEGEGFTVNVPLGPGYGDEDYIYLFLYLLRPIVLKFRPDFILVSAGFDPYVEDSLGGMRVTVNGFAWMTHILRNLSGQLCNNRLALFLEGGYHLEGMARSVEAIIKVLSGEEMTLPNLTQYEPGVEINRIIAWHKRIWKF